MCKVRRIAQLGKTARFPDLIYKVRRCDSPNLENLTSWHRYMTYLIRIGDLIKNDQRNSRGTLQQKFNLNEIWHLTFDIWTSEHHNIWKLEHLNILEVEYLSIWTFEHFRIWAFDYLKIWTFEH